MANEKDRGESLQEKYIFLEVKDRTEEALGKAIMHISEIKASKRGNRILKP